jgi:hypothetical protein
MKKLLNSVVLCAVSIGISACDLSPDALVGSRSADGYYQQAESPRVDHCDRKVESVGTASCFTEALDEVVVDVGDIGTHGTAIHNPGPGEQSYGGFGITIRLRDKNRLLELGEVVYRKEGSSDEILLQCLKDTYQAAIGNNSYNCALIGRKKRTPKGQYILKSIEFKLGGCVQRYQTASDKGHCTHNSSTVDLGSSYVRAPAITVHEY